MPAYVKNRLFTSIQQVQNGQSDYTGTKFVNAVQTTTYDHFKNQSGTTNPGWKAKIKQGVQAGSAYTLDSQLLGPRKGGSIVLTLKPKNTVPQQWTQYWKWSRSAGVAFPVSHLSTDAIKADNQALARLRFKIRDQYENMNFLVTLGEGREALKQMRRPYAELQKSIDQYVERSSRGLRGLPRNLSRRKFIAKANDILSQTWLETTFGLAPTLSDVKSAAETAARAFDPDDAHQRNRVKGYSQVDNTSITSTDNLMDFQVYYRNVDETHTDLRVIYKAGLVMTRFTTFTGWARLGELAGFQLSNFVPTIYELVPYSWLFDYFTTFGEALSANLVDTQDVAWVIRSEITKSRFTRRKSLDMDRTLAFYGPDQQPSVVGSSLGETTIYRTTFSRSLITPSALPTVLPRIRPLDEAFNLRRVGNITAIAWGKIRKLESIVKLLRK